MAEQIKIWFQGATDRVHMAPYISKVEAHLKAILEPGVSYTFNTTSPPATTTHSAARARLRCAWSVSSSYWAYCAASH